MVNQWRRFVLISRLPRFDQIKCVEVVHGVHWKNETINQLLHEPIQWMNFIEIINNCKKHGEEIVGFSSVYSPIHILAILVSHSPIKSLTYSHRKCSNDAPSHTRFDRLSSTLVNYSNPKKKSPHRKHVDQQQIFSTLSRHSGGGDSGYSEESFATRPFQRPSHTSCPHCHCEQRSSFDNYKKISDQSSTESSPSDIQKSSDHFLSSQSYPRIKPIPRLTLPSQPKLTRTLTEKRRRNLSCDGSLWTRPAIQKPVLLVRFERHSKLFLLNF